MHTAPIPKTLQDVRPLVRNMRPDGYILQTGGSATRQEIQVEGDQVNPLFRVTGVPLHTHNASALLQIEASMSTRTDESRPLSYAGEFSELDMNLEVGEHYQATVPETRTIVERINKSLDRAIDWRRSRGAAAGEQCQLHLRAHARDFRDPHAGVAPDGVGTEHARYGGLRLHDARGRARGVPGQIHRDGPVAAREQLAHRVYARRARAQPMYCARHQRRKRETLQPLV